MDVHGSDYVVYEDNQEVIFSEGERRKFKCVAEGGYPKPNVSIITGSGYDEKDMTHYFTNMASLVVGDGQVGLQELSYRVTLMNKSLEIGYIMSDKKFRCEAVVPTQAPKSQGINIKLSGCRLF